MLDLPHESFLRCCQLSVALSFSPLQLLVSFSKGFTNRTEQINLETILFSSD